MGKHEAGEGREHARLWLVAGECDRGFFFTKLFRKGHIWTKTKSKVHG